MSGAENCTKAAVISEGKVVVCDYPSKLFEREEELLSLGLDIPLTSKISSELKKPGITVHSDCTVKGFSDKITEIYGGGENA